MSVREGEREGRLLMFCAQHRINQPLQHSAIRLEDFGLCFNRVQVWPHTNICMHKVHVSIRSSLWTGPKALISEWAFITCFKA